LPRLIPVPAGERAGGLPGGELRRSRLASGWTPIELLKHVAHDELRWLEWRFEGRDAGDPWAGERDGRWYTAAGETPGELVAALHAQAARSRAVAQSHDLAGAGQPGDGRDEPAAPGRVLLHLLQEYARHIGHPGIVSELADGQIGE
jgi:hypothetical protein